jgi:hypothetical protein
MNVTIVLSGLIIIVIGLELVLEEGTIGRTNALKLDISFFLY